MSDRHPIAPRGRPLLLAVLALLVAAPAAFARTARTQGAKEVPALLNYVVRLVQGEQLLRGIVVVMQFRHPDDPFLVWQCLPNSHSIAEPSAGFACPAQPNVNCSTSRIIVGQVLNGGQGENETS